MVLPGSRTMMRPTLLVFALVAACGKGAATTAVRTTVDGEVADSTSGAIVMVTSDGGNTAVTSEWTLDSTGSAVTFVSRQKGAPAGTPPTAQSATIITGNVVKQLFAATQTPEFRALKAHYPRVAPIPDMATTTITIVANGRRRVIDGDYPDPALTLVQQLQGLVPAARP